MIKYIQITLVIISITITTISFADGHNTSEVIGDYDFGKTIADTAMRRGCLGCHSIDKFKGSSANQIMGRIIDSWHVSGFTEEDIRDLSVYLSVEANKS
tara:strand:+ start:395 stop:691 length:297 start_codon:yes stop_codon:yes gene_type:complete